MFRPLDLKSTKSNLSCVKAKTGVKVIQIMGPNLQESQEVEEGTKSYQR